MLRSVALFSGLYDIVVGAFFLLGADFLPSLFGVPAAAPRVFSDLNALFLLAVGTGYALPWRDPIGYRSYMWLMGVFLKTAAAGLFLLDYTLRAGPQAFLLFAASDGALALITFWALRGSRNLKPGS
jgi:hypothetical protein